jgi:hypothetical protein
MLIGRTLPSLLAVALLAACSSSTKSVAPPASAEKPAPVGREVPPELAAMMQKGPCVPEMRGTPDDHTRDLEGKDGKMHRTFMLAPGERLCIVGTAKGTDLADLTLSKDPVPLDGASDRLVSAEMRILPMGAVLLVKNHHGKLLHYRALMVVPGKGPQPTSICPVRPHLMGLEHWPHPLDAIAIGDLALHEASENIGCK